MRARTQLPASCAGAEVRQARLILAALQPERSARDAYAHALVSEVYLGGDGRDPDALRHATARWQAQWQAARKAWPDDIDIAWQAARNCDAEYGCDEERAGRHLAEADPDNAAAWIVAMAGAYGRRRFDRYDAYLARAAEAGRYAPPSGSVFRALQPLLASTPRAPECVDPAALARRTAKLGHVPTPEDYANDTATVLEEALGGPAVDGAFDGCRSGFGIPVAARRRGDCAVVLAMVAEGATFHERETALPLLILLLGNSESGMRYREQYRRLLYLQSIDVPSRSAGTAPSDAVRHGEVAARQRVAIAQHRWPPPPQWMPSWDVQRALIERGTAPTPRAGR